jgi:hypothetical protein
MRRNPPGGIIHGVNRLDRRELARRRTFMSAEENMALARRFMEARVVKRDLDAVDEMLAPTSSTIIDCIPAKNPIARLTSGRSLIITPPSPRAA